MKKNNLALLVLIALVIVVAIAIVRTIISTGSVPPLTSYLGTSTPDLGSDILPAGNDQPASSSEMLSPTSLQGHVLPHTSIKAPLGIIDAEVASSSADQATGLSFRTSLLPAHGMLFPFAYPGDYGFWMKDMRFPIDMVWISSNKRVVSVTEDVLPSTYPTVFYPPVAISYVLELNAGAARTYGIATDTQLAF